MNKYVVEIRQTVLVKRHVFAASEEDAITLVMNAWGTPTGDPVTIDFTPLSATKVSQTEEK